MPLTKIKSLGITDGTILGTDVNSTFDLTGKTVTLPAGTGGKVLQVVQGSTSTNTVTTNTTTTDTTLTANITPSSTSNKILVLVSQSYLTKGSDSVGSGSIFLVRGSTTIGNTGEYPIWGVAYVSGSARTVEVGTNFNITYLDSPSSTSSLTYKTRQRLRDGTHFETQRDGNALSTITLIEIAG